jgi:hypothetical protein
MSPKTTSKNAVTRRGGAVALALVVALGGGTAGVWASSDSGPADDHSVPMAQQDSISALRVSVLSDGAPTALTPTQQREVASAIVSDYGLQPENAKATASPEATGLRSRSQARWTVVPGTAGICLFAGGGDWTCAPTSAFADGRAAMITGPAPVILNPEAAAKGAPAIVEDGTPEGDGRVEGVVPDGYTRVAALDASGREIAAADVESNVYQLKIDAFQDAVEVVVYRGTSPASTIRLQ